MLTVREAADRVDRSPATVYRWIRSGRLPSRRVGGRHLIAEDDLLAIAPPPASVPLPVSLRRTWSGRDMPDVVALIRELRDGDLTPSRS